MSDPTTKTLTGAQLYAELERLRADLAAKTTEAEALRAAQSAQGVVTVKAGQSGTIVVYGLGRNPVALYSNQWDRLLMPATVAAIRAKQELQKTNKAAWDAEVQAAKDRTAAREAAQAAAARK